MKENLSPFRPYCLFNLRLGDHFSQATLSTVVIPLLIEKLPVSRTRGLQVMRHMCISYIYMYINIYQYIYIIIMNNNKLNKYIYICRNMQNISRNRVGTTSSYENEAVGSTLIGSRSSFSRVTVNFWFFSCTLVRACLHLLGRTEF